MTLPVWTMWKRKHSCPYRDSNSSLLVVHNGKRELKVVAVLDYIQSREEVWESGGIVPFSFILGRSWLKWLRSKLVFERYSARTAANLTEVLSASSHSPQIKAGIVPRLGQDRFLPLLAAFTRPHYWPCSKLIQSITFYRISLTPVSNINLSCTNSANSGLQTNFLHAFLFSRVRVLHATLFCLQLPNIIWLRVTNVNPSLHGFIRPTAVSENCKVPKHCKNE